MSRFNRKNGRRSRSRGRHGRKARRFRRSISNTSSSSSSSSSRSRSRSSHDRIFGRLRNRRRSRGFDRSRSRGFDRSRSRGFDRSRSRDRSRDRSRSRTRSRTHERFPRGDTMTHYGSWKPFSNGYYRKISISRRSQSPGQRPQRSRDRMSPRGSHSKPVMVVMSDSESSFSSDYDSSDYSDDDRMGHVRQNTRLAIQGSTSLGPCSKTWVEHNVLSQPLVSKRKFCSLLKCTHPTEFQRQLVSLTHTGSDILAVAEKMDDDKDAILAFGLPICEKIINSINEDRYSSRQSPLALILAPTSCRVSKIASHCEPLLDALRRDLVCLDAWRSLGIEKRDLASGCDVVITTPGRLLEVIEVMDSLKDCPNFTLKTIKHVVIADAQDCCRMGLVEQIKIILDKVSQDKQIVMTSSAFSQPVSSLADEILTDPFKVPGGYSSLNDITEHVTVFMDPKTKLPTFLKMLKTDTTSKSPVDGGNRPNTDGSSVQETRLVLVNDEKAAQELSKELDRHSIEHCVLDSCVNSQEKLDAIIRFKSGSCKVLVMDRSVVLADLGASSKIDQVINFNCPTDFESYIESCRLVKKAAAPIEGSQTQVPSGVVHTFISKRQGALASSLINGLICTMSPVPDELKQLNESYRNM